MDLIRLLAELILAMAVSYVALRARMLNRSGALASTLLGAIVFGAGGWQWAVLLLVFFFTSSVLTKAFKPRKLRFTQDYFKGDRRDAGQVAANGAVAVILVGLHVFFGQATWPWLGFAAALAAANADTWATELGILSRSRPRLVTNLGQSVEPGTSGGVSLAGTLAALGGSIVIAASAVALEPPLSLVAASAIAAAGLIGAVVDSLLGATLQAIYFCPVDKTETEKHPFHTCGSPTSLVRGWPWLNNDWVNAGCTAAGAIVACGLAAALRVL